MGAHRSANPWTSKYEFPRLTLPHPLDPLRRAIKLRERYPHPVKIQATLRDISRYFKRFRITPQDTRQVALDIPQQRFSRTGANSPTEGVDLPAFTAISIVGQFGLTGLPGTSSPVSLAIAQTVSTYRPPDPILNGSFGYQCYTHVDDSVMVEPLIGTSRQPLGIALLEGAIRGLGPDAVSGKYRDNFGDGSFFWGFEYRFDSNPPTIGISEGKRDVAIEKLANPAFDAGSTAVRLTDLRSLYGSLEHWCATSAAGSGGGVCFTVSYSPAIEW